MGDDKRVILNSIYFLLGTAIANFGGFGFRIIVGREFGPDGLGLFSQAILVIGVASTISLIGLNDGIVKFVSQSRGSGERHKQVGTILTAFSVVVLLSSVLTVVLFLSSPLLSSFFESPRLERILKSLIFLIPAKAAISLSAAVFLAYERGKFQILIRETFPQSGVLIIALFIAWIDGTIFQLVDLYSYVYLVSAGLGLTASILFLSRTDVITTQTLRQPKLSPQVLLSFSAPLLLTGFIGMFLNWIDVIVIGFFLDDANIGLYQSAFFLGTSVAIFQGIIAKGLYPDFGVLLSQEDKESVNRKYFSGIRWTIILTVPPVAYLSVFPAQSLSVIFGSEFSAASLSLIVLSTVQLVASSMGPATNLLKVQGQSKFIAVSYTVGLLLNAIISITLVPIFGIIGAAIGTGVGFLSTNAFHLWRAKESLRLSIPWRIILLSVISAGISSLFGILTLGYVDSVPMFLAHIAFFSATYVCCTLLTGLVTTKDIEKLNDAIR